MDSSLVIAFFAFLLVASAAWAIKVVPARRVFVLERLGRFQRTLEPGLHIVIPVVDRVRASLEVGERTVASDREQLVTSDGVIVLIDLEVHYEMVDPQAATYQVEDHQRALTQLAIASMRSIVGRVDLITARMDRSMLGDAVLREIADTTSSFGLRVIRVEITAVNPGGRA